MNTRKFFSRDDVALLKQYLKAGMITLDDIHIIVKNELNSVYNTILSGLYGLRITDSPISIDSDSVIYKHVIDDVLFCFDIPFWKFHTLIEEGYVTTCGRGYTFNHDAMSLTENEYNRLMYLTYELEIIA